MIIIKKIQFSNFLILHCRSQTRKYEEGFFLFSICLERCVMHKINGDIGFEKNYFTSSNTQRSYSWLWICIICAK